MAQAQAKSRRAKADRSEAGRTQRPASFDLTNLTHMNGHNMDVARHMGEAVFDGMVRMNREFMEFLNLRLQEDLKAARAFARCRHPSDFVEAELRFLQGLVHQYAENTNRMLGIAANVVGHNLDDVEDAVAEAARSVPPRAAA